MNDGLIPNRYAKALYKYAAGQDAAGSFRQTTAAPLREPEPAPRVPDSPALGGLFSLFDVSPSPVNNDELDWNLRKKKKKKKKRIKL